jgi:hypothetical protein
VLSYFSDKETQLRWQALFFAAGGAALLWFAGTLASLLRRRLDAARAPAEGWLDGRGTRWPPIIVASAATAIALYTAGTAAYTALAARAEQEIDASAGRALFELGGSLITYTSFPALVFVGAVVADSDTFGPSGAIGIIAFLSFLAWVLVTSGLLAWRRAGAEPARRTRET